MFIIISQIHFKSFTINLFSTLKSCNWTLKIYVYSTSNRRLFASWVVKFGLKRKEKKRLYTEESF